MELLKTVGSSGTVALLKNENNRRISGQQKNVKNNLGQKCSKNFHPMQNFFHSVEILKIDEMHFRESKKANF